MRWLWLGVLLASIMLIASMVDRQTSVIGPIHLGADQSR